MPIYNWFTSNPYTDAYDNATFTTTYDTVYDPVFNNGSKYTPLTIEQEKMYKIKNKEEEEEVMEYNRNGVVFKNNKVYFENYGQTEQNAFSTSLDVENGDLIIAFKEQNSLSRNKSTSDMSSPAIVFDVSSSGILAGRISDGKISRIPKEPSAYRTIVPNEYLKDILNKIFDDENIYKIYKETKFRSDALSIKDVAYQFEIKYKDFKKFIKGPACIFCGKRTNNYRDVPIGEKYEVVCPECFEKLARCNRCGNYSINTETTRTRDNRCLCKKCSKYHFVTPYHHYYPNIEFFGNNKDNQVPYLGLELEVDFGGESDSNAGEVVEILNKNKLFAYCSHDGSLDNGFEIITQPATMEYHNSIKHIYASAMNKLKEMKYSSHNTSTCGMHVHFNRDFFGVDDTRSLSKFIFITEKFWNELVVYSRRPEFRMEHYAKKISPMKITEYINMGNKKGNHDFHYYSVNITNNDTIELRTFKGTLNVDTILATLQLVNNMAIIAKNKSLSEIQNMSFEDFLTTKYQKKYWERHKLVPDGEE